MGKFKSVKRPFQGKSRKKRKSNTPISEEQYRVLQTYNKASWFNQDKLWEDDEDNETSASRRKIILPEEDIDFVDDSDDSDEDSDLSGSDMEFEDDTLAIPQRHLILDIALLQNAIYKNLSCRDCGEKVKLFERTSGRSALATKLLFQCKNSECTLRQVDTSFFTTPTF